MPRREHMHFLQRAHSFVVTSVDLVQREAFGNREISVIVVEFCLQHQ